MVFLGWLSGKDTKKYGTMGWCGADKSDKVDVGVISVKTLEETFLVLYCISAILEQKKESYCR